MALRRQEVDDKRGRSEKVKESRNSRWQLHKIEYSQTLTKSQIESDAESPYKCYISNYINVYTSSYICTILVMVDYIV